MKISQILILSVLFCSCVQVAVGARRTANELGANIKTSLKASLQNFREPRNLRNAYFLYKAGAELKVDVEKIATELQLCANLKKVGLTDLSSGESQIYLVDLSRLAKCGHNDEKSTQTLIDKYSQSNLVQEYIAAVLVKKTESACARTVDFFAGDGTTVLDLNDKQQKNLYYTPFLVEIVEKCGTKPGILQSAVKSMLLNTHRIYKTGLTLIEGDSVFVATAQLVYSILNSESLKNLKEFQERINGLASFIGTHSQYIEDGEDLYAYARASEKIKHIAFFELESAVFDLTKKTTWEFTGLLQNIQGQPIKGNVTVTGTISKTNEKITFAAKKDAFSAKFGSAITEPGYYTLNVDVSSAETKNTFEITFLVRKKIQVDTVRFDVINNQKRPAELANEVKGGKPLGEVLKSNQNGFIFVSFKVTGIQNPAEVVLRLVHPQYFDATGTIAAKFNKETDQYDAVLDLGNPDVILPYNAVYKLNLTVADPYGENFVQWTLSSFQLTFTKNQQGNPPTDSDYKLLPEIKHVFPAERIKPNPLITLVFVALVLVALAGFFYQLGVLKVDFGRYPSNGLGPIFALLLVVDILALLGILTWFWVEINLFQTLGLLSLAIAPTVIFGNLTFNSLETQEEDDAAIESPKQAGRPVTQEEHKKQEDPKGDKKAAPVKVNKPKKE